MTEYTPSFKSIKENGNYPIRSNMVLIKNQGNCTVMIDYVCELPPNGELDYNMGFQDTMCVWDIHIAFKDDFYPQFNGDDETRKNLIIGESRIVGTAYSNYSEKGS
jgi:hypothetical protein